MKHSCPSPQRRRLSSSLLAATLFASLGWIDSVSAAAVITASSVFNAGTKNYTYSYSILNTGSTEDLVLISVPVDPLSKILGISAPVGFALTFDPSQGQLSFIEDGSILTPQTFAPGSNVGTFSFTSIFAPTNVTFTAFDAAGAEFSGTTISPVPEPTGLALIGLAATAPALRRRRQS